MIQKTVFITGTSSGFGQRTVPLLLAKGYQVIAGIRGGESRGREIFSEQSSLVGTRLFFLDLELDPASGLRDSFLTLGNIIAENCGNRLDAILLNAGFGQFGAAEEVSDAQLHRQMEVNFFSPAAIIRELLPRLKSSRGKIIVLSSIAGRYAFPYYGAYSASKFALEAWIEALHFELRQEQSPVQICLVEPGGFATSFNQKSQVQLAANSPHENRVRQLTEFLNSPHRRAGNPQHVAELLLRLVEAQRIPLRKLIGKDAILMHAMGSWMPSLLRIKLVSWFFSRTVFRG